MSIILNQENASFGKYLSLKYIKKIVVLIDAFNNQ
ncbi:hypothetical protein B6N60_05004 [Richelia sinica FACHB-800]|uniref:Uncharacterized protein n=1 Tax=Richelia sinica FACHB-800 TaxID=1357546 RepID=A0A975TDT3_9NOST|nr:hypothetical protein B6N60_05004 [Richelia sinica FACHB-800]